MVHVISSTGDRGNFSTLRVINGIGHGSQKIVKIGAQLKEALAFQKELLKRNPRQYARTIDGLMPYLYSDASWKGNKGRIAIVWWTQGQGWKAAYWNITRSMLTEEATSRPISFLETAGGICPIFVAKKELEGKLYNLSIDNNNALSYLLRKSGKLVYRRLVSYLYQELDKIGAKCWYDRVPSQYNISDIFTRPCKQEILERFFPGLFCSIECQDGVESDLFRLLKGEDVAKIGDPEEGKYLDFLGESDDDGFDE